MATNYDLTKLVTLGQLQMALEYIRDLISGGTGDTGTTEPGPVVDPELGSLILTKIINGETEDTDFAFDILVGEELKQITLNKDEDYTIDNLEDGTEFTITETDPKNANSVTYLIDDEEEEYTEGASVTGKIVGGEITYISAVNNYASEEEPEPEARTLTIAKEVEGLDDSEVTFDFKVVIAGEEDDPIEFSINTEEEQPITLTDLEGEISVTVTEVDSKNANEIYYSVDGGEFVEGSEVVATIAEDVNDMMIVFKNVYKENEEPEPEPDPEPTPEPTTGSITVSKFIEGTTDKSEFSFIVELSNDTTEEFTINTDESNEHTVDVEFSDEDEDIWYTITEVDSEADLVEWDIDEIITEGESVSGYMAAGEAVEVVVTNTYNGEEPEPEPDPEPEPEPEPTTGTVTISKVVEGTTDDSWYIFEIKTDDGECKRTFLANGESHTVELTADSEFTVEELESGSADTVTYSIDGGEAVEGTVATGTVVGESDVSVVFTNTYKENEKPEPTTGTITISKQVDGETDATDFEFELTYGEITKQFTLNDDGNSESFEIEVGTEYTVMETDPKGADSVSYLVDDDEPVDDISYTGVVVEGDTNITFVNTYIEEEPEPEPDKTGTLSITKTIDVSPAETDRGTYKFELTVGDDDPEEVEITIPENKSTATVEKAVAVGKEFTLKEVDSKNADVITYSVDGSDDVEGDTVTGIIEEEDSTLSVDFTNTYLYLYMNPDHYTTTAGKSGITVVINTSGDASVECDCDKVEWELRDPSGFYVNKQIYIISSESSTEDYTATFTITSTLNGKEIVGTYTLVFEADEGPAPAMGTLTIHKDIEKGTTDDTDRGEFEFELSVDGEDPVTLKVTEGEEISKEILANTEFTLTEVDSKEADSIMFSIDGGDYYEGDSAIGAVTEDGTCDVTFLNKYLYIEPLNPDHYSMSAGKGNLTVVFSTNGTPEVTCDCDKVDWTLKEPGGIFAGYQLVINSTEPSYEEYVATFTITSVLGENSTSATYTLTLTANEKPTASVTVAKIVEGDTDTKEFNFNVKYNEESKDFTIGAGEEFVVDGLDAETELTITEVDSDAEIVSYSIDDSEAVEGNEAVVVIDDDCNAVKVEFTNTYDELYIKELNPDHYEMSAGKSLTVVFDTNGTPEVTCECEKDIDFKVEEPGKVGNITYAGYRLIINAPSSYEDYTATFTITSKLGDSVATATYVLTLIADEEKLDDLVLNPDNSTSTAGFSPITIVFSTNGTPTVECDSDKVVYELKEPGGIFTGYQLVINSSEESDEDYVVHFTITCTLGDDQMTSAVYTLTFTANN